LENSLIERHCKKLFMFNPSPTFGTKGKHKGKQKRRGESGEGDRLRRGKEHKTHGIKKQRLGEETKESEIKKLNETGQGKFSNRKLREEKLPLG